MANPGASQSESRKRSGATGSDTSEAEKRPQRTIAQIEADLARDREELTATLDALKVELDPRTQAARLRALVTARTATATRQARSAYDVAGGRARQLARDVSDRKPSALGAVAGVAVAVILVAVVLARRGR